MSEIKLSWSSAEVDDSVLTVPLDGDIQKQWRKDFETTVRRLGHGEWGEVAVKRDKVRVTEVTPGSEEKLRHHLESIVLQANAAQAAREQQEADENDEDGEDKEKGKQREGPDAEMTGRFREFGEDESAGREDESEDADR
jgi:hypothetical protein